MNMLPINAEYKRRGRWAEKQRRCGKTLAIKHDKTAYEAALKRAVITELREFPR